MTTGGITQARQQLGHEPVKETFAQVAEPVATLDTEGTFLGPWRQMSLPDARHGYGQLSFFYLALTSPLGLSLAPDVQRL